jgi:hypothetical protein
MPFVGTLGCDDQQLATKATQAEAPQKMIHHFEPIAKSEGSLAVDTATGQMCKTWDWVCKKPNYWNPYTKQWEENDSYGVACSAITAMPTCKSISEK